MRRVHTIFIFLFEKYYMIIKWICTHPNIYMYTTFGPKEKKVEKNVFIFAYMFISTVLQNRKDIMKILLYINLFVSYSIRKKLK